ncbi:MAG: MFS transporter [Sphingomonadales bacterium]
MKNDWAGFARELKADRGWRVIVVAGVGYGLGLTVLPFYTLGAFVKPLEAEFGWSRGQVQGALVALMAATLVAAWAYGWLTDRHGVRKVALASQVGLGIGLCLLALTPGDLRLWYAGWFVMSLLGLGTSPITWTRGVAGWFDAGRGLALSLGLAGSGIAALVAPAGIAFLIEHIGWRWSYVVQAAAVLLIGVPTTWFLFPRQSTRALVQQVAAPAERLGLTMREILCGWRFWVILSSCMAAGFAMAGMIPNLVPMLVDRGFAPTVAASYMGVLGIAVILGRLAAGYALDRLWAPIVACLFLPWPALSCFVLAQGVADPVLIGFLVALLGLATGAEFDLVPFICTRYFGMRSYGRTYALQWVGFTVASGIAPALFGHTFDVTGTYAPILYVAGALFLFAPLVLLLLGRYPALSRPEPQGEGAQDGGVGTVLAKAG